MSAVQNSAVLQKNFKVAGERRESVLTWRVGSEKLEKISRRRLPLSYILKERISFTQAKRKEGLSENSCFRNTFV